MANDTLDFAFAKARRDMTAELARDGWDIELIEDPSPGGPKIFLVDAETGYVQICQGANPGLAQLAERWRHHRGQLWEAVCDTLGAMIGDLARQKPPMKADLRDAAKLACLYTAGTETYARLVDSGANNGTVLIIRFPHANDGEHWLRPAALTREDVLTPPEVLAFAAQVLEIDRVRHPERFPRAVVIQLTPRG